jgi:hypothetical protein
LSEAAASVTESNAAGSGRLARQAQPEAAALFISDLHLQPDMPGTAALFLSFLERHAMHAGRLYLLGDLFEYWAGDDDIPLPFMPASSARYAPSAMPA